MPEKITRKGAFWSFRIFDILSGKQTVNGAIEIIDNSTDYQPRQLLHFFNIRLPDSFPAIERVSEVKAFPSIIGNRHLLGLELYQLRILINISLESVKTAVQKPIERVPVNLRSAEFRVSYRSLVTD